MGHQKSQQTSPKLSGRQQSSLQRGTLFIVGTPIGSLDDLTIRARTVLGEVSLVVAETPLATRALLDFHGITTVITGYGGGDEDKIAILLDRLNGGHNLALVSDSGMPVIYDPGRLLIAAARASGHRVTVVPGPSAVTAAAALSGESADRLLFVGRLPRSVPQLDRFFKTLRGEAGTTVMFAPCSALPRILERIRHVLPNRTVTLAINMTTPYEQLCRGDAGTLLAQAKSFSKDSEMTLVLSGARKGRTPVTAAGSSRGRRRQQALRTTPHGLRS
ncbi:MAG TPA: SAM-dependent methyltransferase [Nitrospira sp.]|nr:SAM-dependent methyltransferase [Nitrospira sp.]